MSKLMQFEIPVPPHEGVVEQYLALGWYKVEGNAFFPPRLKWSHGAGAPRHPGDPEPVKADDTLSLLDYQMIQRLQSKLPEPAASESEFVEISFSVTVQFKREAREQRHKGAKPFYVWEAVSASMLIFDG
jgi:hypothetical protein